MEEQGREQEPAQWPRPQWPGPQWPGDQARVREQAEPTGDAQAQAETRALAVPAAAAYPMTRPMAQLAAALPSNGLATAGMVLGITSVIFCWWGVLSLAQCVLAIVFGSIGVGRANRGFAGHGQAVAGIVLGSVGLVLYLIVGLLSFGVGLLI